MQSTSNLALGVRRQFGRAIALPKEPEELRPEVQVTSSLPTEQPTLNAASQS